MAKAAIWSGASYVAIYRLQSGHAGIGNATTGVAIPSPVLSDAAIVLKYDAALEHVLETSEISFDGSTGAPSFKVSSTIPDIITFLEVACPRKTGTTTTTKNERTDENGSKIGGTTGGTGDPEYLAIYHEGKTGSETLVSMVLGNVSRSSGGRSSKAGDSKVVSFEFSGISCKKTGGLVLDQALFDATIWGTITAGLRTIGEGYYIKESFLPQA